MKLQPDNRDLRAYLPALVVLAASLAVDVALWFALGNLFYLANFAYIGSALAAGIALMIRKVCPMNVDILDNARSRENGTECILCAECINTCPKGALKL